MSHLLTKIQGNKLFYFSLWAPRLYVYDDLVTLHRRNWFVVREMTISYNQIAQVNLTVGLLFGSLEIITTSNDTHTILVKYANKAETKRAKRIIDQKVHAIHSKDGSSGGKKDKKGEGGSVQGFEKSLTRLKVLLERGRISKREFEKRRKELLGRY